MPLSAEAAALIKPANTVGMVGWWRFDEGGGSAVADFSGQGNVGTLVDMEEADWVAGHVGTAIDLDGAATEHVVIDHDSSLSPTSAISMVAWIKPRTFGTGVATLVEKEYLTSYLWYLNGAGGDMIVNISGSDAESELSSITTDVWQHVAFTYDGLNVRFYVNSLPAGVSPLVGSIGTDTSDLQIGNDDTLVSPFDGYVDDVRIYNRILSQVEIRQIMEGDRIARYASTPDASGSLAQGLVGHWTLDGKDMNWGSGRVTDKSTQGNNGYVINMSTTSSPADGRLGQALSFDGVDDSIVLGVNSSLDMTDAVSVSAWVKPLSRGDYLYITSRAGNAQYTLGIRQDGIIIFYLSGVNNWVTDDGSKNLFDGAWHQIVATYNNVSQSIYIDGILIHSTNVTGNINSTSNPLRIGTTFKNLLDDVRIYNRALSASEISKLYNSGKVTHDVSMSGGGVLENGLVSWWTFDGPDVNWGSGRVTDKSGQGNTGYVINMSTTSSPTSGKVGQALSFDGADDLIRATKNNLTSSFSVSMWLDIANNSSGNRSLMNGRGSSDGWGVGLGDADGELRFTKSGVVDMDLDTGSWLSGWNNYTWVVDSNYDVTLYVNGVSAGSYGDTQTINENSSNDFTIGCDVSGVGVLNAFWNGSIDDVRIYNRALSASEVKQLYSGRR